MKALDYLLSQPLLATPEAAEAARRIVEREPFPEKPVVAESEESETRVTIHAVAAKPGKPVDGAVAETTIRDGVAIIPVCGPIFRYADWFTELCGGATVDGLARDFSKALSDPMVESILFNIDSPGGQANGIGELAAMIREGSMKKPVCAYVGHEGCSAAYWIAAACPTIVLAPGAFVGSIGVVMGYPKPDPKARSVEFVASQSPRKRPDIGTEGGKAVVQARVDDLAEVFIDSVGVYRGTTSERVMADFGQGGVLIGAKAVAAGMADRVGSFEATLSEMAAKGRNAIAPKFRSQAAAVAKATTPTSRSRPMSLRSKLLAVFSGASTDEAHPLTEAEKLQALDAVGAAEETSTFAVLKTGDDGKAADRAAAVAPLNIEDSPQFKAQAQKIAAMEAQLAAGAEAKLKDDAATFARGLAAPSVHRINTAQIDGFTALYGRVAKADTDGSLMTEFRAFCSGLPTASDRFARSVAGKEIEVVDSVGRSYDLDDVVDEAAVARMKKTAGIDN